MFLATFFQNACCTSVLNSQKEFDFPADTVVSIGNYMPVIHKSGSGMHWSVIFYYDTTSTDESFLHYVSYPNFPAELEPSSWQERLYSIYVTYEPTEEETRTVSLTSLTGSGTVEVDGQTLSSETDSVEIDDGETVVTIEATPDEGWEFDSWSEDASGETETSFDVTIEEDYDIGVTFSEENGETSFPEPTKSGYFIKRDGNNINLFAPSAETKEISIE